VALRAARIASCTVGLLEGRALSTPSFTPMIRAAGLVVLLASAVAQGYSPIPPFPGDGAVAVDPSLADTFGDLRAFLRGHKSPVGARYHVAIVGFSDRQNRRGGDYGDDDAAYIESVAEAWRPHLDAQRAVIILLAIHNRDIIVKPFSRWSQLGWEQQAVVRTIDGSSFATYARAGDYSSGIQALIADIDVELRRRVQGEERQRTGATALLPSIHERVSRYRGTAERDGFGPPAARAEVNRAQDLAERAASQLQRNEVALALATVEQAVEAMSGAEALWRQGTAQVAEGKGRLDGVDERLAALDGRLNQSPADTADARAFLGLARAEFERAAAYLIEQRGEEALAALDAAEHRLKLGVDALGRAELLQRTWTRIVPGLVLLGLLVLVAALAWRKRSRARLRRAEAEALCDQWQRMLTRAGDNLVKLEDTHALILGRPDLVQRFDGDTAAPVREAAAQLDEVFVLFEAAQRLLHSVRALVNPRGPLASFREGTFEQVVERLTLTEVVARTEDVKEHALFLPGAERLAHALKLEEERVRPERRKAEALLGDLRSRGLRLSEPGFEPDAMLRHAARAAEEMARAIDEGRDQDALAAINHSGASLSELQELCERARACADGGASRIAELEAELEGLRLRLPERRERLAALQALHADDALQPALDNADQAVAVLAEAEGCLGQARTCISPLAQRYLAGADHLDRCGDHLEAVHGLFEEIEQKADELAAARRTAEQAMKQAEQSQKELEPLFAAGDAFASAQTLEARAAAPAHLDQARRAAAQDRPDWQAARDAALSAAAAASAALERARREKPARETADGLMKALLARKHVNAELLKNSADDGPATNDRFREATLALEAAQTAAQASRPVWPDVVARLQQAAELLESTERMAEQDFAVAKTARQALAEAQEAVQSAGGWYGHGIKADLGEAREALERVKASLQAQQYPEARAAAEQVRVQAQAAKRLAAERALAADEREAASRNWRTWSNMTMEPLNDAQAASGAYRSRSITSSFSSGSSFGSSSGRASFGSSSGRSSFGSSSGRSKW
jgi:hypothetical protein